jgi:hypothetical protein
MARVLNRWQFSHPSTSDLDHVKDESVNLTALAERRRIRLRATASGVPSGLSRTRDVRWWHKADVQTALMNVRFEPDMTPT